MVFGNLGTDSGSGVAFTRDPVTGAPGRTATAWRTPRARTSSPACARRSPCRAGARSCRRAGRAAAQACERLERALARRLRRGVHGRARPPLHPPDPRRQAHRRGRGRGGRGLATRAMIDRAGGADRVAPQQLSSCCTRSWPARATRGCSRRRCPPRRVRRSVRSVFRADDAVAGGGRGGRILVRQETSPEDFHGMVASRAILTARGGLVSHAAVVARGLGKPAVCGAAELVVDEHARTVRAGATTIHEGDVLTRRRHLRAGLRRRGPADRARARPGAGHAAGLGRRGPTLQVLCQRRHRADAAQAAPRSAPRASACAAPSTSSSASACAWCGARSSPRAPTRRRRARRAARRCSATTSRVCCASWRAAGHGAAAGPAAARVPARPGRAPGGGGHGDAGRRGRAPAGAAPRLAGVQPDAGRARLPAGRAQAELTRVQVASADGRGRDVQQAGRSGAPADHDPPGHHGGGGRGRGRRCAAHSRCGRREPARTSPTRSA